ncbi:MAG: hypothetical protein H6633_31610 [Anaerolineales bacterium]|nr:hypothetical protein [Anaerolineales bacterium]
MYYRDERGDWQQHPTWNHPEVYQHRQDLKYPCAYVSEHFYYFGEQAVEIPPEYRCLIRKMKGATVLTIKNCKWVSGLARSQFQAGKARRPS